MSKTVNTWWTRLRRALHYALGPSADELTVAKRVLGNREYYQLYDDLYRDLSERGSVEWEASTGAMRDIVHASMRIATAAEVRLAQGARLLDLGCGVGENAVRFARAGHQVTGIDISPTAIEMARRRAAESDVSVDFRVGNVLDLSELPDASFDVATDVGCLHMLVREEHRRVYMQSVRRVLRRGGLFFVFNRASPRDVRIADPEAEISRNITFVQKRWRANDGSYIHDRGCGFRNASLGQYQAELEGAGFIILRADRLAHVGMAVILARAPDAAPPGPPRE